jgi:hypothetical protein
MAHVPFKLIETTGDEALAKWRELKSAGQGSPVILGGDYARVSFDDPFEPSAEDILRAAAGVRFPGDLARRKAANGPPVGEWPAAPSPPSPLYIVSDFLTGKPLAKVTIALAPTDDWTTIPAYLCWGGWNACPAPEYHVAAMRAWRDRYGAELVGVSVDTIYSRVASRPKTRKEALALARDQYIYCTDLIDQGGGTYSALAADLMANDWWRFWWD